MKAAAILDPYGARVSGDRDRRNQSKSTGLAPLLILLEFTDPL